MKNLLSVLFISVLGFVGCIPTTPPNPNSALTQKNVSYGPDAQQTMDIYLPANRSVAETEVVLFIHGGGWSGGDKSNYDAFNWYSYFNSNGYAVININYRLVQTQAFKHPVQLNDIDSAISFLSRKSNEWAINPNKIVLMGASAGGHLSLLYGYSRNQQNKIKGVADLFGPTDFTHSSITSNVYANGLVINYLGSDYNSNPQLWKNASPNYHLDHAIPTIIFQGGADGLVLPVQSQMLRDSLNTRHIANQYVYYAGEGHGWSGANLDDTRDKMLQWIKLQIP